jgi:hypothetical protein
MNEEAEDLIHAQHRRRFRRIARSMDKLIQEIREYCPGANMYLEDQGNWHLMVGDSHDWSKQSTPPMQDRIAVSEVVRCTGGGAW